MKKTVEVYYCDFCHQETDKGNINSIPQLPVIFETEQEEGRATEPYLSSVKIDLCNNCLPKIIVLRAKGAHGHNTYSISKGDKL